MADSINIPDWTVYVQALVCLVIPALIAYAFKRFRSIEDE
jgi:hypothetical protein